MNFYQQLVFPIGVHSLVITKTDNNTFQSETVGAKFEV